MGCPSEMRTEGSVFSACRKQKSNRGGRCASESAQCSEQVTQSLPKNLSGVGAFENLSNREGARVGSWPSGLAAQPPRCASLCAGQRPARALATSAATQTLAAPEALRRSRLSGFREANFLGWRELPAGGCISIHVYTRMNL